MSIILVFFGMAFALYVASDMIMDRVVIKRFEGIEKEIEQLKSQFRT